jgi:hypothetical protein
MDKQEYAQRMEAVNFTMAHDDGSSHRELGDADVILVGVSRSGKTPTSLYLALQFGVKAANYPLIPEDFDARQLPEALHTPQAKLYGLTIAPERLQEIRRERRPGSQYADPANCRYEIEQAEALMRREASAGSTRLESQSRKSPPRSCASSGSSGTSTRLVDTGLPRRGWKSWCLIRARSGGRTIMLPIGNIVPRRPSYASSAFGQKRTFA